MFKKLSTIFVLGAVALVGFSISSCDDDDITIDDYKEWRDFNNKWLIEQTLLNNPNGTAYYERMPSPIDPTAYVLMHPVGEINTENLKPLYTSVTKVNYTLRLANDSLVDQGTDFVSMLNSQSLIAGWSMAIMQLHVGDSAQFIIPYELGYGISGAGTILPYSNLQFNIRLVDIVNYETKP